jgi:hypothetical protein
MSPHRQSYPGLLPALPAASSNAQPSWQPRTLADSIDQLPPTMAHMLKTLRWDWIFDLSCNLAGQFRALGMTGNGPLLAEPSSALMVDESTELGPEAAAHAWVFGMVQRTAMEIRQMQLLDEPRVVTPKHYTELTGIAFLAHSEYPRGTGRRLTRSLQNIARTMAERCDAYSVVPGSSQVQFLHARPVQLVSPLLVHMALPVAAYRVRYTGMDPENVLESLRESLEIARHGSETALQDGDVMMLSNLWAGQE